MWKKLSKEDYEEIVKKRPKEDTYETVTCRYCSKEFRAYVKLMRKYCSVKCAKERNNYE